MFINPKNIKLPSKEKAEIFKQEFLGDNPCSEFQLQMMPDDLFHPALSGRQLYSRNLSSEIPLGKWEPAFWHPIPGWRQMTNEEKNQAVKQQELNRKLILASQFLKVLK